MPKDGVQGLSKESKKQLNEKYTFGTYRFLFDTVLSLALPRLGLN